MSLTKGHLEYPIDLSPVSGEGRSWASQAVDDKFVAEVSATLQDRAGLAELRELLSTVAGADFDENSLLRLRRPSTTAPRKWRVGEALAECYLVAHRACEFPWSSDRDRRTPMASLPGVDLVGFVGSGKAARFAFGEVKTSSEPKFPPRVMSITDGLPAQLDRIRDNVAVREQLAKYLSYRLRNLKSLARKFSIAWARFDVDSSDVRLFGVLVRDVPPKDRDLSHAVKQMNLGRGVNEMPVELLALYLPLGEAEVLTKNVARLVGGTKP